MCRILLLGLLGAACGDSSEPGPSGKPTPEQLAECEGTGSGAGRACFAIGSRYHVIAKDTDQAILYWKRGCERGDGASCGQLGTVVELGLGGRKANPVVARSFYTRACKAGDEQSCKALGKPGPAAAAPAFAWKQALRAVCGDETAQLGAIFEGLELGAPMPAGVKDKLAAWEKQYKARVRYEAGTASEAPYLEISFDEPKGLAAALAGGWGPPDLAWGAWASPKRHLIVSAGTSGTRSTLFWSRFRSVEETVLPADPARFGFEPIAVIGAKLAALKDVLGDRLKRSAEDAYRWQDVGFGPAIDLEVTVERDVIVKLEADMITNSNQLGEAMFAALVTKYGPAKRTGDEMTWRRAGVTVTAKKPASGNFAITLQRAR